MWLQLWAISKVHVRAENATDMAAAWALQQGITVRPAASNATMPTASSPASQAEDLFRRAAAAAAQPYTLWGSDRGPYTSKGDPNSVGMPKHEYKVGLLSW